LAPEVEWVEVLILPILAPWSEVTVALAVAEDFTEHVDYYLLYQAIVLSLLGWAVVQERATSAILLLLLMASMEVAHRLTLIPVGLQVVKAVSEFNRIL